MIAKEHLRSLTEPNEEYRDTEEPADTKENCVRIQYSLLYRASCSELFS